MFDFPKFENTWPGYVKSSNIRSKNMTWADALGFVSGCLIFRFAVLPLIDEIGYRWRRHRRGS